MQYHEIINEQEQITSQYIQKYHIHLFKYF